MKLRLLTRSFLSVPRVFFARAVATPKSSAKTSKVETPQENFFPEFISTLDSTNFESFYQENKNIFSHQSINFALDKALEIHAKDPSGTRDTLDELLRMGVEALPKMNKADASTHLSILTKHNESSSIPAIFDIGFDFTTEEDPKIVLFVLKQLIPADIYFEPLLKTLKSLILVDDEIKVRGHTFLIDLLSFYSIRAKDIEMVELLESKVKSQVKNFTTMHMIQLLEIFSISTLKQPNLDILDEVLHHLSSAIKKFSFDDIHEILMMVNKIGAQSVYFWNSLAKHLIQIFSDQQDLDINKLAHVFYMMVSADVHSSGQTRRFFGEVPRTNDS